MSVLRCEGRVCCADRRAASTQSLITTNDSHINSTGSLQPYSLDILQKFREKKSFHYSNEVTEDVCLTWIVSTLRVVDKDNGVQDSGETSGQTRRPRRDLLRRFSFSYKVILPASPCEKLMSR